ncbi:unnamed protein product [Cochlearia groenlandica]
MEKILQPYEKQYMKMAMLKHEETFKEQVYELHRLYRVQKILMKNMKVNNVNSGLGTYIRRVDHETGQRPVDFPGGGETDGENIDIIDENEIELTLGPSCYGGGDLMRLNKKKKKNNNSSPDINSGRRSFSSSSTGSSNNNVEEKVRLMKHNQNKQPWLQALTLNVI